MTILTEHMISQAIIKAWESHETSVTINNILRISWDGSYYDVFMLSGAIRFRTQLKGWTLGVTQVPYSYPIDLVKGNTYFHSTDPYGHGERLFKIIARDYATKILKRPELNGMSEYKNTPLAKWHTQDSSLTPWQKEASSLLKELYDYKIQLADALNKEAEAFTSYYDKIFSDLKEQKNSNKLYNTFLIGNANSNKPFNGESGVGWSGHTVSQRAAENFPALMTLVACPECEVDPMPLIELIQHLNDAAHKWARFAEEAQPGQPNIADWLDEWSVSTGISLEMKEDME
jgi:hypothetical protein